jgi:hypothetical protein
MVAQWPNEGKQDEGVSVDDIKLDMLKLIKVKA